jgi:biopolymer transport protein ExbD
MKMSARAKRMQAHHNRRKDRTASLNMVSLMDIFTVLVFFLLISSGEETLTSSKAIQLPESTAQQSPKESIVIAVNDKHILLQGRSIALVKDSLREKSTIIPNLYKELTRYATRSMRLAKNKKGLKVTIMGDKNIPFKLLKKIMVTCSNANYSNISLAVLQKPVKEDS